MRACVQRVLRGCVRVENEIVGQIGPGLVVLLGVGPEDTDDDARFLADKLVHLRIFNDQADKMNLSLLAVGGQMLAISQFTLMGDCRKGRRPSFVTAAAPDLAESLYDRFVAVVRTHGVTVATGTFRAHMEVELVNDGPVTMLLDSKKLF